MAQDQRTLSSINLGQGLQVSEQGLGCMSVSGVYGSADDVESLRMINHALDIGVTFLDTANIYGAGHSETLLSQVLKTRRDEVTLATKAGIVRPKNPGDPRANGDPAFIKKCLDESLQRLGVDEVDLYYYHRVDSRVPIEETVGAYAELVQAGKIKHIGLSEVTTHELQRAHQVHPITAIQMEYSLFSRDIEKWLLPAASELGVGVVPYASLGRGFFNGAAESLDQLPEDDIRHNFPRFAAQNIGSNLTLRDEIFSIARDEKITPGQLSLAWVYEQGRKFNVAMAPIPGTRYTSHLDENVSAISLKLSAQALTDLDALANRVAGERQKDIFSVSKGREEQQMSTR
ncbi:aldo/keto reductase [Arthrobacter sp. MYb213]|uniref:aldo/keto reductase n=1 Tax=Arthrobacter sp. MYb213 TaxID=1848595 RepID=UPI000CFBD568|nr:aldo/keto reductase [Arthrobacter sp. MYb213]PRB70200.1 aldo/keto reductase [Arthrobacter sp. MYb213]